MNVCDDYQGEMKFAFIHHGTLLLMPLLILNNMQEQYLCLIISQRTEMWLKDGKQELDTGTC